MYFSDRKQKKKKKFRTSACKFRVSKQQRFLRLALWWNLPFCPSFIRNLSTARFIPILTSSLMQTSSLGLGPAPGRTPRLAALFRPLLLDALLLALEGRGELLAPDAPNMVNLFKKSISVNELCTSHLLPWPQPWGIVVTMIFHPAKTPALKGQAESHCPALCPLSEPLFADWTIPSWSIRQVHFQL